MLSQKQKDKINLLRNFKGIDIKRRNEKGELVDYFVNKDAALWNVLLS